MVLITEREIKAAYGKSEVAARYVDERFASELNRLLHDRQCASVQRVIDRHRPRHTLEIAPGPGRLTRAIRPTGSLVCLEYNEAMIAEGRAVSPEGTSWIRGDGFRIPLDGGFDLAYSFRFVRHFGLADRARLYAEIRRVLAPGGHFVMDAVNERISRPLRLANPEHYPIYDKLYQPGELRAELAGAGLEVVEMVPVQRWFGLQNRSQIYIGPRVGWINRGLIRALERMPRRDGLEWIVTCRRA